MGPHRPAALAAQFNEPLQRECLASLQLLRGFYALVKRYPRRGTVAGATLLSRIAAAHPRVTKAWVDAGYRATAIDHGAPSASMSTPSSARGFTINPRRRTVERGIGWLMHHRPLARDYETRPHRSEAMTHLAMTDPVARRLTGQATPNCR
ncbi:DDE family transposase [Streptomyces sp. TLI_146]|nr:transposase [Streptomyces sp. TLI_146]PKV82863.1 DDE family transposase [Streptomyces sp. TLI_146]